MKRYLMAGAMFAIVLGMSGPGFSQSESTTVEDLSRPSGVEPPMLGIHWARGFDPNVLARRAAHSGGGGVGNGHRKPPPPPPPPPSPNMTNHGGAIIAASETASIFWGTSWGNYSGDEITGMNSWYAGFGDSNYAKTCDEYSGTNGTVTATSTYDGAYLDTSAASGGNSTSAILAEVCKEITKPVANGYYAVYTDQPRGSSGYCAYHSAGFCGGTLVQFAFFWKLDGDPGCDPGDSSGLHSQGLAALANVSGHELSESRTDPSGNTWYDSSGQENGDKCAWTFGAPLVSFSNSTQWKIQGEWSNSAYNSGTGYPNSSGQKGCLSGF